GRCFRAVPAGLAQESTCRPARTRHVTRYPILHPRMAALLSPRDFPGGSHGCLVVSGASPGFQASTVKAHQASAPTHARTIPKPVQMRTRRLSDSRLLVRFQTIAVVDRPLERW